MTENTIKNEVLLAGKGLFSGEFVECRVAPCQTDTGITFYRNGSSLKATIDSFTDTKNYTCLSNGIIDVAVVEHLFAAFWACGIYNADVFLVGNEIPNYDGSAIEIYHRLKEAGTTKLHLLNKFVLSAAVCVGDDDHYIHAKPSDIPSIAYRYEDNNIGKQTVSVPLNQQLIVTEILPARTFITYENAMAAVSAGLVKHYDASMAVVVKDGVPDKQLRFQDEYARHKVLDLIGDLFLCQVDIRAKITACRSGHALNRQLAREINKLK